jgi:glycosyltransferase involved in cell wall biosynthesis
LESGLIAGGRSGGDVSSQGKGRLPEIAVIIPAFNEADSITKVLGDIPKGLVGEVVVVDNNSTDATSEKARKAGATVLSEPRLGYGFACLKGLDYLKARSKKPDIVVFLDADYSDYPKEMASLIKPVIEQDCDLVIGSRSPDRRGKGAMPPHQLLGNWLAVTLIRLVHGARFSDLGPFRAIKFDKLTGLGMKDRTYGWPVEMQLKAVKQGLRICEIPVSYRARIGKSKVSGSVKGSILAGFKIIATIFRYR